MSKLSFFSNHLKLSKNCLRIFGTLICLAFIIPTPAFAEKRLALVIGINAYQEVPALEKATGDAKAIGAALERVGFTVTTVVDAGRRDLNRRLSDFEKSISPGDLVLLQFSGHGVEIDGQNYLLPADVPRPTSGDRNYLKGEAISLNSILDRLNATGAATRILIIDACRDNPFAQAGTKGIGGERGLARVEATAGTFIMFSAGYGETALDRLSAGDNSQTSVFTRVLLKHLTAPGEEITDVVKDVRGEVEALAKTVGHKQRPAYYDELSGRLVLNATSGETVTPSATGDTSNPVAEDYQLAERVGTQEAWDAFLAKHGNETESFYVDLARAARTKLALVVPPPPKIEPGKVECDGVLLASTGAADKCLKAGDEFTDCEQCPNMVVVPAGNFTMGSLKSEKDRGDDEGPQREVTIAEPIAVGKFEVTRGQYAEFVAASGHAAGEKCRTYEKSEWTERAGRSFRKPGFEQTDDHPAVCVNWEDAQAYVKWLSGKTGAAYRLLSEAEWEYAARAGSQKRFSFGDADAGLCDVGNGADKTARARFKEWTGANSCADGYIFTAPAGSFVSNDFGLHDLHGNVWEWVQDCYEDSYRGAPVDGTVRKDKSGCYRVLRGGSWIDIPLYLRSAIRLWYSPGNRYYILGFRLARTF